MDRIHAGRLWNQLCVETVGGNGSDADVERVTALGSVATSHGLPHALATGDDAGRAKVAAWLRRWADEIEQPKA